MTEPAPESATGPAAGLATGPADGLATGPAPRPPVPPVVDAASSATTAGERQTLEAFLDFYRDSVVRKVRGVSEADARRRLVPSATTLGGIVKHLRWVEQGWFQRRLVGRADAELPLRPGSADDPDAEFRMEPGETLDEVLAEYVAECARSREAAAGHDLDEVVPHHRLGRVSLRWIYQHMIEETARHAGHADILRELVDGVTGV